ncbi:MAG: phosphate ABC transporter permease PstA [Turicibacter sp.]|nr:phosphate ABC transporter permease PstA [Turicibacter sp.]
MNSRKIKDGIINIFIWAAAAFSVGILIAIVYFIFSNGLPLISSRFITAQYNASTNIIHMTSEQTFLQPSGQDIFSENLGIGLEQDDDGFWVNYVDTNSPGRRAINNADEIVPVEVGQLLQAVTGADGQLRVDANTSPEDVVAALNSSPDITLRLNEQGGGVWPLIVTTLLLILTTLLVAAPIGILAAIYMVEYAKPGKVVNTIRFATEILAGIPSIVYGLFGFLVFVNTLHIGQSILAGALTLMILLLPTMIRTTEEALKTVPMSYREASYGLGANKIQTISKVVLPSAIPGITVGVILAIGRIVGESAALLMTLGTFARLPVNMSTGNLSLREAGTTLTVRAYVEVNESGNVEMAAAIGIVILVIVFALNIISKLISRKFSKANY